MEEEKSSSSSSYTYWVRRDIKEEAKAPLPLPRKLTPDHNTNNNTPPPPPPTIGSVWNSAGTWEEKSLNKWAHDRLKELLVSVGSLDFSTGKAQVSQLTKCEGDAFVVTVRNKKSVGYSFELTLLVKGEWILNDKKMSLNCYLDIPDFSFGELHDLQMQVRINDDKGLLYEDKKRIIQDLNQFLNLIREKLLQFENEIKDR